MEQVITNLLSNAIKYSPMDTTVEVLVGKQDNDSKAYIGVKDQGPGIPEKEFSNLFKPFFKIPGNRPTGGETSIGLGLAIVKGIVEAHHGDVQVESIPKEYTLFKVVLPLHVQPRRISSSSSYSGISSASIMSSQGESSSTEEDDKPKFLNVLIADDNNVNRRLMAQILEKRGHDVTAAADGEEAIQMFEEGGGHDFFHILLLDEEMPKLSGIQVIKHIREKEKAMVNRRVPIVSISGHCTEEHNRKTTEAGADVTFSKPFKVNEFIQVVEAHGYKSI
jgi:CheY-like chemotaxis protein/anti-sigma regulatory factor (Ser/Thr protein kinase)